MEMSRVVVHNKCASCVKSIKLYFVPFNVIICYVMKCISLKKTQQHFFLSPSLVKIKSTITLYSKYTQTLLVGVSTTSLETIWQ